MRRMLALANAALEAREPLPLVGDTGLGKTTLCQPLAEHHCRRLHIVNVHEHTDTADLIGSLRPVRARSSLFAAAYAALHAAGITESDITAPLDNSILGRLPNTHQADVARAAVRQANALFEWADGPLITA